MNELRPVVLVTRACSDAGVRIVEALRRHGGFAVRVMVPHDHGTPARFAATPDVEIVRGDSNDFESLRQAMAGCWGVVGCAPAALPPVLALLDAVADAGVGRVALFLDGADGHSGSGLAGEAAEYALSLGVRIDVVTYGVEGDAAEPEVVAGVFAR